MSDRSFNPLPGARGRQDAPSEPPCAAQLVCLASCATGVLSLDSMSVEMFADAIGPMHAAPSGLRPVIQMSKS